MKKIGLSIYWCLIILTVITMPIVVIVNGHIYEGSLRLFYIDMYSNKMSVAIIFICLAILIFIAILCIKSSQKGWYGCWEIYIYKKKKTIFFQANKICYPILLFSVMWLICCAVFCVFDKDSINSKWNKDITIGHSFGGIDGDVYTGSREAFKNNYELGHRTFEVDLLLTSDKEIVLCHDWERFNFSSEIPPTEAEFMSSLLMDKYTPMSFTDLCILMNEYDDIWIVLDTKDSDSELVREKYQILIETVKENEMLHILDRIIVQIYNEEMYEVVKEIYPFKQYIFTLYMRWYSGMEDFIQICRWSVKNGIDVIAMPSNFVSDENIEIINKYQLDLYVHTINDTEVAQIYFDKGVKGIYTDFIIPSQLGGK